MIGKHPIVAIGGYARVRHMAASGGCDLFPEPEAWVINFDILLRTYDPWGYCWESMPCRLTAAAPASPTKA